MKGSTTLMRVAIASRLVLMLGVALLLAPCHAQFFSDVPAGTADGRDVTDAACQQLMEGYPDGTFRPDAPMRRAESVMVFARLLNIALRGFMVLPGSGLADLHFTDVPATHWMFAAAQFLTKHGMLDPGTGTPFRPKQVLTRGEFAAGLYRILHAGAIVTPFAAASSLAEDALLPAAWSDRLSMPVTRREVALALNTTEFYLTQNAVTQGKIVRVETDEKGEHWVILDTVLGEGRLYLPQRGIVVRGGVLEDLRAGTVIRTMSDAVPAPKGSYFRVRDITILPSNA